MSTTLEIDAPKLTNLEVRDMAGILAGKLRSIDPTQHDSRMIPLIRIQEQAALAIRQMAQPDVLIRDRKTVNKLKSRYPPILDEVIAVGSFAAPSLTEELFSIAESMVKDGIE